MLGGALLGEVGAPGGGLHAEGGADPGDLGADPAEADHAEAAPVQIGADGGLPGAAGAQGGVLGDQVAGEAEDEGPGQLDGGVE